MTTFPPYLLLQFVILIMAAAASSNSTCTLQCRNKGKCLPGLAPFGYASELDEDDPNHLGAEGGFAYDMYCECPQGFAGVNCEIALVMCADSLDTCFNGSPCVRAQDDMGGIYHHCECDAALSDLTAAYATGFCQQAATIYCSTNTNGGASGAHSFCTNGGRCKKIVDPSEPHQGCECTEAWEGNHCQFYSLDYYRPASGQQERERIKDGANPSVWIVVLCVSGIAMILALTSLFIWRYRASKKAEEAQSRLEMQSVGDPYGIKCGSTATFSCDAVLDSSPRPIAVDRLT